MQKMMKKFGMAGAKPGKKGKKGRKGTGPKPGRGLPPGLLDPNAGQGMDLSGLQGMPNLPGISGLPR